MAFTHPSCPSSSSGSVERTYQSRDPEGCTYQSSDPERYTYQSSDPEGCTYQSSAPEGCTYQSSAPEGCTYQSSAPEGCTYQSSAPEGYTYPFTNQVGLDEGSRVGLQDGKSATVGGLPSAARRTTRRMAAGRRQTRSDERRTTAFGYVRSRGRSGKDETATDEVEAEEVADDGDGSGDGNATEEMGTKAKSRLTYLRYNPTTPAMLHRTPTRLPLTKVSVASVGLMAVRSEEKCRERPQTGKGGERQGCIDKPNI
ncbi:NBS-LRR type resistance protein [Cucumis melo var. makuwa]|uniref:NBS-LRR type resistance protein n=1 Tax=Cucumis melo var. makuwa TaxID=1194695 RepID=A0A5A7UXY3_CUCMM|nr:NBS-LRR type resistance protein [Cucumis melo var. makuwa]